MIEETDGEIDNPENYNSFADIETFLTNKHEKLVMDVRDEGDNVVGLMSQIGWTEEGENGRPTKVIPMEKIYIVIDTNGGNGVDCKYLETFWGSIFHSKIQHRTVVMQQVANYLSE